MSEEGGVMARGRVLAGGKKGEKRKHEALQCHEKGRVGGDHEMVWDRLL